MAWCFLGRIGIEIYMGWYIIYGIYLKFLFFFFSLSLFVGFWLLLFISDCHVTIAHRLEL